jgi:quinolinate synthase
MSAGVIPSDGVQVLSTEGMIRRPSESANNEFIVATETGILHRLRRANPDKTFFAASDRAECQYMKMTTLPKVLNSLENLQYRITVPPDVAAKARLALERMVAVGGSTAQPLAGIAGFDPGE